jgi:GDPmannose 4,6-dehydratase
MFACSGILFNHESPLRGHHFVTRKITIGLAKIKLGLSNTLELGNLEAKRDWGFAGDYVNAMYLMLNQKQPDDYVISTGESHSVAEFVEESAKVLGFDFVWEGKGIKQVGIDRKTGKEIVKINSKYFRPSEVDILNGDSSKAKRKLGWKQETSFNQLVKMMVDSELCNLQR